LIPGNYYRFKVRARNALGWGSFSSEIPIKAATRPDKMAAAVTNLDSATGGVRIAFTAPSDNADTITAYKIEIAHPTSQWSVTSDCDGSNSVI
jgi:hypothetical protein